MGKIYFIRFSIVFWILALVHLISNFYRYDFPWVTYLTKPAIGISLLLFFVVMAWKNWKTPAMFVVLALVFSIIGDVFLLSEDYFLYGLGSFLFGHVFYAIAFTKTSYQTHDIPLLQRYMLIPLAFLILAIGVFVQLKPQLGDMLFPVIVYIGVVTTMAMLATNRYGKVKIKSFAMVLTGALLFLFSDSLIAFNKFQSPIQNAHLWIMGTYILAQYFIVMGMVRQIRKD